METLNLQQGSPEWLAARVQYLCSSDAAAMLGFDTRVSRAELLRMKATGDERAFTEWEKQYLLAKGHEIEASVRGAIERELGEDLFPVTGARGALLASYDGMSDDSTWSIEVKSWNEVLAAAVRDGDLPNSHWPQLEQQIVVGELRHVKFVVSNGKAVDDPDFKEVTLNYTSRPERRQMLMLGWRQFKDDLAKWQHVEHAPAAVGSSSVKGLPVLVVRANGQITESNFDEFHAAAMMVIDGVSTSLVTDQDFADADENIKSFEKAEKQLETVEAQVLAGMTDINKIVTGLRDLRETMRKKRLNLNSTVTTRKEARRAEILKSGQTALAEHVTSLNQRLGKELMPAVAADFAGAMRAKKTIKSLVEAVDGELTRAKITASATADGIDRNLKLLASEGVSEYAFLFADLRSICLKANDDFSALVKTRVAEHVATEARKKADADAAAAKKKADEEAARQRTQPAVQVAAPTAPSTAPDTALRGFSTGGPLPRATTSNTSANTRPDDDRLVTVAADAIGREFGVSFERASEWLQQVDWTLITA